MSLPDLPPLKRQPRQAGDLERGFYQEIWNKKFHYCCLFCQFDARDILIIEYHVANHLQFWRVAKRQEEAERFRPLAIPLFDPSGRTIDRIEKTPEELANGSASPDPEDDPRT